MPPVVLHALVQSSDKFDFMLFRGSAVSCVSRGRFLEHAISLTLDRNSSFCVRSVATVELLSTSRDSLVGWSRSSSSKALGRMPGAFVDACSEPLRIKLAAQQIVVQLSL
ncbi:Uncharacterized protein Rs2_03460 [Raphanus sativus]|nr:Uncharacterized protein Rs2_03460 [Raphanus sativus]